MHLSFVNGMDAGNVDGMDDGLTDGMDALGDAVGEEDAAVLPPPEEPSAPAEPASARSADEKLHAAHSGISVDQFAEWRSAFDEWVAQYESRKLMSSVKLAEIHDLYCIDLTGTY